MYCILGARNYTNRLFLNREDALLWMANHVSEQGRAVCAAVRLVCLPPTDPLAFSWAISDVFSAFSLILFLISLSSLG